MSKKQDDGCNRQVGFHLGPFHRMIFDFMKLVMAAVRPIPAVQTALSISQKLPFAAGQADGAGGVASRQAAIGGYTYIADVGFRA